MAKHPEQILVEYVVWDKGALVHASGPGYVTYRVEDAIVFDSEQAAWQWLRERFRGEQEESFVLHYRAALLAAEDQRFAAHAAR